MAKDYTHGTYGVLKDAIIPGAEEPTTATVAVGTLPVHLLADSGGLAGTPLACVNANAKTAYGYCSDWASYTLCEVMQAFLGSADGNQGGLYLINVLDPEKHRAAEDTTEEVTFSNGRGYLADTDAIVATLKVEGDVAATASYDSSSERIAIDAAVADGQVAVTYRKADPSKVTASDVAAAVSAVEDIYPAHNVVPNLLIAPGWSDQRAVYEALVAEAQAIDGHFFGFVVADLDASPETGTIEKAIEWKAANAYDSKFSKVCWPRLADASGKVYHVSTLFAREMVRNDGLNEGVPFVTASNTAMDGAQVVLSDGATQVRMYEEDGNLLNAHGISTAIAWAGGIYLWGGHTAAYAFGVDNLALGIFDTNMRMLCYILNDFQTSFQAFVDRPMTVAMKDTILFAEQQKLNAWVAQGALLGDPTVSFQSSSNDLTTLANGEFTFDMGVTPTPQAKTLRAVVAYTTEGLSAYFEEVDGQ